MDPCGCYKKYTFWRLYNFLDRFRNLEISVFNLFDGPSIKKICKHFFIPSIPRNPFHPFKK